MNITGLDLVCAITRRCHFFALAVGFVNPSSQLASLIGHAQHRTHTHPELARNAAALREQYAELLKLRQEIRKLTSSRTTLLLNSNVGSCHQSRGQPRCTDGSH